MSSELENPYAPPKSTLVVPDSAPADIASTGARFANYLIDGTVSNALGSLAVILLAEQAPLLAVALNFAAGSLYLAAFEWLTGRTLGKLVTGTHVIAEEGGAPSLLRILGRTLARWIPFEAFSFLFGDGRPVGWHDSLSKTRVVRVRRG